MRTDGHGSAEADVLRFFRMARQGVVGKRLRRLRDAELALGRCIDDHAETLSTGADLVLLRLEQQLAPDGAGARLAPVDVVLRAFEPYLTDDRYSAADDVDRKLRLRLVWRLGLVLIDSLGTEDPGRAGRVQLLHDVHLTGRRHCIRVRREESEARLRASMATATPEYRAKIERMLETFARIDRERAGRAAAEHDAAPSAAAPSDAQAPEAS